MVSEKQLAANQLNAQESTGPVTEEGKAASSENARTHGLASEKPLPEAEKQPKDFERKATWMKHFKVEDNFREHLVDLMVNAASQLDDCTIEMRLLKEDHAQRATNTWDIDRREEAVNLAKLLATNPWRTVPKLETTTQGCDVLIDFWNRLKTLYIANKGYTPEERDVALNILGIQPILRNCPTELDPPNEVQDKPAWVGAVIDKQVARLQRLKATGLDASDASRREAATRGGGAMFTKRGALIQRYVRDAERRFFRALEELKATGPAPIYNQTAPQPAQKTTEPDDFSEADDICIDRSYTDKIGNHPEAVTTNASGIVRIINDPVESESRPTGVDRQAAAPSTAPQPIKPREPLRSLTR